MLGHERIRRSVQPKSTYRGGKAKEVTLNLHLENEPIGCVIWMMLTRTPLSLVLSCGSADLQARPWLSSMVRSAGIRRATATESRPSGRTRASFQGAGFGGLRRSRRSQQRCSGGLGAVTSTPGREAAHRSILLRYLRANARSYPLPDDGDHEWLERARCREFSSMPEEFAFVAPTSSRTSSMGIGWPTGGVRRSAGLLLDDFGRGGAHRDLE